MRDNAKGGALTEVTFFYFALPLYPETWICCHAIY